MNDIPKLVFLSDMSDDELRRAIEVEIARWMRYRGMPFLTNRADVEIIDLRAELRIEPEIEDEP